MRLKWSQNGTFNNQIAILYLYQCKNEEEEPRLQYNRSYTFEGNFIQQWGKLEFDAPHIRASPVKVRENSDSPHSNFNPYNSDHQSKVSSAVWKNTKTSVRAFHKKITNLNRWVKKATDEAV